MYILVKLLPRDLNLDFCLPHLTSTYTYVMIIAQKVHSDKASQFLRYYKYVTKLKYIQRDNLTYVAILYTFLVPKFHSNLLYTFFFWEKNCYILWHMSNSFFFLNRIYAIFFIFYSLYIYLFFFFFLSFFLCVCVELLYAYIYINIQYKKKFVNIF